VSSYGKTKTCHKRKKVLLILLQNNHSFGPAACIPPYSTARLLFLHLAATPRIASEREGIVHGTNPKAPSVLVSLAHNLSEMLCSMHSLQTNFVVGGNISFSMRRPPQRPKAKSRCGMRVLWGATALHGTIVKGHAKAEHKIMYLLLCLPVRGLQVTWNYLTQITAVTVASRHRQQYVG